MKTIFIISISSLLLSTVFYTQGNNNIVNEKFRVIHSIEMDWPKDIDGLIKHLNSWDKAELDTYERPEANPNRITSGETSAWIIEHKKLLKALGATVVWNKEKMQYERK